MNHSVEVPVYWFESSDDELFKEMDLEVTFEFNGATYEVTGHYLNGDPIDLDRLKEDNPRLYSRIDIAIEDYIANYENDYVDYEA